jgi:hypothetical protein
MTEGRIDPKIIEQQEQQHAERNRSAVQRALQPARHEEHQERTTKPGQRGPDLDPKSSQSETL